MDIATREAKIAEIFKQLTWLEANKVDGSCLCGDELTLADLTWMPTCVFMEFLLPRVFGWADPFGDASPFPRLAAWYRGLLERPAFAGRTPRSGTTGSTWSRRASSSPSSPKSTPRPRGSGPTPDLFSGRVPLIRPRPSGRP